MADQLPSLKCPLKLMGLMSNPAFVKNIAEEPGYMEKTVRDRPILVRCEREKCAMYSKYHYEETVETEKGEHEETRVAEGCAIALLPERLHDLTDVPEAIDDMNSGLATLYSGLAKAGATALGIGAVVAQKYGMTDELNQVVKAVKRGETEPDEDDSDEEEEDEDSSDEEEEEEEDARTSKANG